MRQEEEGLSATCAALAGGGVQVSSKMARNSNAEGSVDHGTIRGQGTHRRTEMAGNKGRRLKAGGGGGVLTRRVIFIYSVPSSADKRKRRGCGRGMGGPSFPSYSDGLSCLSQLKPLCLFHQCPPHILPGWSPPSPTYLHHFSLFLSLSPSPCLFVSIFCCFGLRTQIFSPKKCSINSLLFVCFEINLWMKLITLHQGGC